MMSKLYTRAAIPALVLVLSAACGETPSVTETGEQGAATFVIVSGDGQTGPAGEELPQPLVVRAVDASGAPLPGRHVAFHVVAGGGEMYVGGGVSDATGIVKDYWTLGRVALDSQRVEARSVDPVTGAKQVFGVFTAHAVAGAPAIAMPVGTVPSLNAPVRSLIRDSLRVEVRDRFNNPVRQAGVAVKWIPNGNGNINTSNGITYTNAQGVASALWRFSGTAGTQTLSTSVGGGQPTVAFTGNATPGPTTTLNLAPGSVHFDALGSEVQLTVTSVDAYGNATQYTLNSTAVAVATVNGLILRSMGNGTARVIARSGALADTATVTVQQVATSATFRSSFPSTLKVGGILGMQFYTYFRDANGNLIYGVTDAWTSSNPSVAMVASDGKLRGVAPGTVQVTATLDGVTAVSPVLTITP